ncbi:hypothetical protein WMY93_002854 [Mugilogobius chulae]|uniref:Peroxisomal bifunctional enzyme n=1 Tax=Mugilogobius chulae TaxID=88201 RepID=A0AAW0PUQ4_9GOBI
MFYYKLLWSTHVVVFCNSAAVRQGIVDTVQKAVSDPQVKSVVICGQNGIFCGGADIKEFGKDISGPPLVPVFHAIESADKPVVAAIEGSALGGGLELALFCHYRITHSKARLGLPEVTLGLLPAAGGTQRLPRLIGVPAALDLITTGRHVTAAEALKLGFVDQVIDQNTVEAAVKFALSVVGQSLESRRISTLPCPCPDADALFEGVMQKVRQRARGAIAPVTCVQAIQAAVTLPYAQGMQREQELMATLFTSAQARALQYCFFSQRVVSRWSMPSGARWDTSKPKPVTKVAVIGLGTMGRGITVALAQAGLSVVAVETEQQQMIAGQRAVSDMLERAAQRRGVSSAVYRVRYSMKLEAVADVQLVIEAVFEDMVLKEQLFKQLSSICKADTLLCSNTSALDIDHLASQTRSPQLVVGMHFFAPAHVMKLLEVVHGPRSAPQAVATAMELGKRIGKVSVAVGNCRGFVGNRMLMPYSQEALFLVEEGASPEVVDRALEEFGFPMGFFRMSDLSGLDVGWRVRKADGLVKPGQMSRVRQGRRYCPLGDLLCEQGRFELPRGYRARQGLVSRRIDSKEVLERCLYSLINEGFRILEDGIAAGPEDIDMIYVFGYGWPRHRGGPMFYASQVGLDRVLQALEHYQQLHPDVPHLQPSRLLRKLVSSGSPPIHRWKEVIKKPHSAL